MGADAESVPEVERVERLLIRAGVYVGGFGAQRRRLVEELVASGDSKLITDESMAALRWVSVANS